MKYIYDILTKSKLLFSAGLIMVTVSLLSITAVYFDKALAIDPGDKSALNNKGVALDNLGNSTGDIEYYDKALAIDPADTLALNNKGVALR